MSPLRTALTLFNLPPERLRDLARQFRECANRPCNGLMPTDRLKLRQNAMNPDKLAARKAEKHARQNRHPEHLTLQLP